MLIETSDLVCQSSGSGQTETSARQNGMSVTPSIADIAELHAQVRSAPTADIFFLVEPPLTYVLDKLDASGKTAIDD